MARASLWRRGLRSRTALVAAVALVASPALLDLDALSWLPQELPNTVQAALALVSVFVTAVLVDTWNRSRTEEQDRRRFEAMSVLAFRSISQGVNDAGRIMSAPVIGGDLALAGVPGFHPGDAAADADRLERLGLDARGAFRTGFWRVDDEDQLAERVRVIATDREFASRMFQTTSRGRRRLQEVLADWAPVMVTVPDAAESLGAVWELSDHIIESAEAWRAIARGEGEPDPELVDRAATAFMGAYRRYLDLLAPLQEKAELPTVGGVALPRAGSR